MKIGAAQTRPVKGDIGANIARHLVFVERAVAAGVDLVVFPELSITGYEPALAAGLATTHDDPRFDALQRASDDGGIAIGFGLPTPGDARPHISLALLRPHRPRQTYDKRYLHADEEPFFSGGRRQVELALGATQVALAICYELSVPQHAEDAAARGAGVYVASSVKDAESVARAVARMAHIAREYAMTAVMANCVGTTGGHRGAGRSAAWGDRGELLGQLDAAEGLLVVDTDSREVSAHNL